MNPTPEEIKPKIPFKTMNAPVEEVKLLPCPFCGSEKLSVDTDPTRSAVVCGECGGQLHSGLNEKIAIKRWNTRTPSHPPIDPTWVKDAAEEIYDDLCNCKRCGYTHTLEQVQETVMQILTRHAKDKV